MVLQEYEILYMKMRVKVTLFANNKQCLSTLVNEKTLKTEQTEKNPTKRETPLRNNNNNLQAQAANNHIKHGVHAKYLHQIHTVN